MILVAGWIRVDPGERAAYLAGCRELIGVARASDGCLDFHLSADPIEADRINVFEQWAGIGALEAFRGSGPPGSQSSRIREARVLQHEVASTVEL